MSDRRVRRMSPLAVKTYMMLLHEAFVCSTRPNLPDDDEELYLMAYCSNRQEWESIRDEILGMFSKSIANGKQVLVNSRLCRDWEHLQEIREARAEAGKKGGLAKATKSQANSSKEVSKQVGKQESEVKEEEDPDMKLRDELTIIAAQHKAKAGGYKTTWDEIKTLGLAHGNYAVASDFKAYMEEFQGDDFPNGAVVAYLKVAADRLASDAASTGTASQDPDVISLTRELIYLSGDKVTFQGRHKPVLAGLLKTYTQEELIAVFKTFVGDKDLDDSYVQKYVAQNFLDAADGLAYSARKRKEESDKSKIAREATVQRIQAEAEAERLAAESFRRKEEKLFDPLAHLMV